MNLSAELLLMMFISLQQSTSLAGVPRTMARATSAAMSARMMLAVMPHSSAATMGAATRVSAL